MDKIINMRFIEQLSDIRNYMEYYKGAILKVMCDEEYNDLLEIIKKYRTLLSIRTQE